MALLNLGDVSPQMDQDFNVKVLSYRVVPSKKFVLYTIQINVQSHVWTLERRYSEFDTFDNACFPDRKKSFLPPKKMLGNKEAEFLDERKRELEKYCKAILELEIWHQRKNGINALQLQTARFFDFHQYEVHSIVDDLSTRLRSVGDEWLATSAVTPKYFEFTPIELFAVTERLRLAEPTSSDPRMKTDIGYTIEFLHNVKAMKVRGRKGNVGNSNIVWNSLDFSLHMCKGLMSFWLSDSDAQRVKNIYSLKDNLRRLVVHYSMKQIRDLLLDEEPPVPIEEMEPFTVIDEADFSFNELHDIDESVRLLATVKRVDLSHNSIRSIGPFMQHLTCLTELSLSHNNVENVENWYLLLGNLKILLLAGNNISKIEGLSRLYALECLDLRDNNISNLHDVTCLSSLPCLETIVLRNNPIRDNVVDYRSRVLQIFGERASQVKLDNRRPDDREMDTVRVRIALQRAKEEKLELEQKRMERIRERERYISGEDVSSASSSNL